MGQGGIEQGRKAAINLSNNTQEEYLDKFPGEGEDNESMSS